MCAELMGGNVCGHLLASLPPPRGKVYSSENVMNTSAMSPLHWAYSLILPLGLILEKLLQGSVALSQDMVREPS